MKFIFKLFCVLLITSIIFSSCIKDKQKKTECNHEMVNCYPNNERPSNAITYKEMADMIVQYEDNQEKILKTHAIKNFGYRDGDTKSNWFPIDELKQYIAYVEKLSKEKDIKLTGIRIFSAAYPDNEVGENYKGRQTLILTPTTKIEDKDDVAFEPLKSSKGNPLPMLNYLAKFKREKKMKKASFLSNVIYTKDEFSSAANRSHLSPPN